MPSPPRGAYRIGSFTFDLIRGALVAADGAEITLRPKSFTLLRYLAENAGRLLGREELMQAVWPGVFVTEDSLIQCVKEVRRALGDAKRHLLRTLPRRGYLFAVEVSRAPAASPATALANTPPQIDRPMVVVLPFTNMTGQPEQEHLADGITEDLTTALSHARWFSVVARNSAFTYKGRAVDVRQVGRELGASYALEGSIRTAGSRVRVTAQLCSTEGGQHVWARSLDGDLTDLFAFHDRITAAIVGTIEPSLRLAEAERSRSKPTDSLGAYDLYLRALPQRYLTREHNDEALRMLRRAVALDPGFSAGQGELGRADLHPGHAGLGGGGRGGGGAALRARGGRGRRRGRPDRARLGGARAHLSRPGLRRGVGRVGAGLVARAQLGAGVAVPQLEPVLRRGLANGARRGRAGDAAQPGGPRDVLFHNCRWRRAFHGRTPHGGCGVGASHAPPPPRIPDRPPPPRGEPSRSASATRRGRPSARFWPSHRATRSPWSPPTVPCAGRCASVTLPLCARPDCRTDRRHTKRPRS